MNELQYTNICKACDKLLLTPVSTIARIAIPLLHVIRPHPTFYKKYNRLFNDDNSHYLRLIFAKFLGYIRLCRVVLSRELYWVGEPVIESEILIISHLINENIENKNDDFYYGDIASKLLKQGHSVTIALINHTDVSASYLIKKWSDSTISRVIFSPKLDLISEIKILRDVGIESRKLQNLANDPKSEVPQRIINMASIEALSGGTIWSLRLGLQIKKLVSKLKAKCLIITYEGHSWERVAFASAREASAHIQCIGYQHATLFNGQHAIKRVLGKPYDPDIILTSGSTSKNQFDESPMSDVAKIIELGSNRFMKYGEVNKISNTITCIVLPEGIETECKLLFKFSLNCAKVLPEVNFIWRLHPNMNLDKFFIKNPEFKILPKNINVSARSLGEDFQSSHFALYRGSTAIVQAVCFGIKPIYLSIKDEISINTLYDMRELHNSVNEIKDFISLIENLDSENKDFQRLQEYCRKIFTPVNADALISCL